MGYTPSFHPQTNNPGRRSAIAVFSASIPDNMVKRFYIAALAVCIGGIQAGMADDDDEPTPAASAVTKSADDMIKTAGIITQALTAAERPPEFNAVGVVINPEPLISLRQQVLTARAQHYGAMARYRETDSNLARTRHLHDNDIVSTRRLQEQQALWQGERANLDVIDQQQTALLSAARLQWGETLTQWFTRVDTSACERFLKNRSQLVQITTPADTAFDPKTQSVFVETRNHRTQARRARFIAQAPDVDPVTLGSRWFYEIEGQPMPFGAQVGVWIGEEDNKRQGVRVPTSAIVWHLGKPCVFIKAADGRFTRLVLNNLSSDGADYVAFDSGISVGQSIVVTGAQTLLSQELASTIPDDD